jgi:hypothetical protein
MNSPSHEIWQIASMLQKSAHIDLQSLLGTQVVVVDKSNCKWNFWFNDPTETFTKKMKKWEYKDAKTNPKNRYSNHAEELVIQPLRLFQEWIVNRLK